ncbi:hypothetical protein [Actinokineospora sp. NBRC 105648]|uniref:hypothetical protein n=1 Tax=Actinokineospora sp. NBRC 105648 TaxID=3032206 RepID=UPI0024A315C3|nr:hypothetical protein [Actinokineospora sp. NBRC 105648]GLZ41872.1 hypothetical protein Acsp05_54960 [Actinokineospora sp. NBRC 105648]
MTRTHRPDTPGQAGDDVVVPAAVPVAEQSGNPGRKVRDRASAAVAAGVGAWVFLPLGGRISITEIAAVLLAPAAVLALLRVRRGRAFLVLGAAWLGGLLLGHVLHPAPTAVLVKALSSATVLVLTVGLVCAVLRLHSRPGQARDLVIAGFAVGQVVGMVLTPPAYAAFDPWKFGLGQAFTLLVLIAVSRVAPAAQRVAVPVALVALAALHLVLGSRSLSLFALLIALAAAVTPAVLSRRGWGRAIGLAAVAVLAAVLLGRLYADLAESGELGSVQQQKIQFQNGDYGVGLGGRKDVVFLASGIVENPLTGWGPAARVPSGVKTAAVVWLRTHGYPIGGYDLVTFVLPDSLYLHSVLLGAWVTGGILALPLWLLVFGLIGRAMIRAVRARSLAEAYLLLVAAWHILFSPLGDSTRGHIAVAVALSLTSLAQRRQQRAGGEGADQGVADPGGDGGVVGDQPRPGRHRAQPGQHTGQENAADDRLPAPGL